MEANQSELTQKSKKMSKHAVIMILCCLIPVAVILVLWLAGIRSVYLTYAAILLCPLLHIIMMPGMNKRGEKDRLHH